MLIKLPFRVILSQDQLNQVRTEINLAYFSDPNCNKLTDKGYVGKYDHHPEMEKVKEAHHKISRSQEFVGVFNVGVDGKFTFIGLAPEEVRPTVRILH
jgi:hypothetical protein